MDELEPAANVAGADPSKEDAYKFLYVTKGPARVQQKKLFYVYGRGMEAKDGTRVKPTQTKEEGRDYSWPGLRVANHLYYKLTFSGSGRLFNNKNIEKGADTKIVCFSDQMIDAFSQIKIFWTDMILQIDAQPLNSGGVLLSVNV